MNTKYEEKDKQLFFEITEEIDHHTTEKIRRKMDNEIQRYMPKRIIFDFNKVTFMDSAGIGMLIGRYKMMKMLGGTSEIINVKPSIKKIFEMCGLLKIIPIRNNAKNIS
ncbi:MAG: anti-sigma F factor antagonist [Clostridia bacterium]|nr:anti-sigma F factor antagonist [Clostridia bacterium]